MLWFEIYFFIFILTVDWFWWVQQDYKDEEIRMGKFAFRDNRNILNAMLSKPDGLLAVVDEQSRAPDSTDASILSLFHFNKLMSELAFIKIFQRL
jgi:myosin heavy subunit